MCKYVYGLDIAWCIGIVIYDLEESKFVYVGSIDAKKIKVKKNEKDKGMSEHGKRLRFISEEFKKIIDKYPPSIVSIERYFGRFNNSTIALAKIHGIINEILAEIPQVYYPPKKVKEAIIRGDATKKLLQNAIKLKYKNISFNNEDESDAFAIALTYLIKNNLIKWDKKLV